MKNYKTLLLPSVIIASLIATSTAFAAPNGNNPFDAVWTAITALQNQIAELELLPGLQGPQGETPRVRLVGDVDKFLHECLQPAAGKRLEVGDVYPW